MAKLNIKKLTAAATNRGGGGALGGALNPLIDKVLPVTVKPILKTGLKIVAGAVAPELVPKIKMADYAGAGLIGAAVSDYLRENVEAFKPAATSGIGNDLDKGYVIDEDRVNGPFDESGSPISGEGENRVVIEGQEDSPMS